MKENSLGFFLEEYKEGAILHHALTKTIFESDNNLFSLLTMNHHPVHTNIEYAKNTQHGKILVVGTLVFSIIVGMTVNDISGKAIANLDYEKIEHIGPVFVGDTLHAETEILGVRESETKADRGIIYVETRAFNQCNKMILRFRRRVLVKKKGY